MKNSYLKISLLVFATLLGLQISFAQIIQASTDSVLFPITDVGNVSQIQIILNNRGSQNLQINNVKFYQIYGDFPFSANQTSFNIPANGSYTLTVNFSPEHNIFHNSELVIFHNGQGGMKSIDLRGQGRFPNSYYSTTQNLEEQALKNALKARTGQGYTQLSYNVARDAMFMTIDNKLLNGQNATTNTLECVYTGYNKTGYTSRSDAQTTTPQFNTEHTFPQGFFNQVLPQRSDLHHLFPTTNNSNSQRGSKPFGVVTNGTPVTLGGGSFYNNTTFEPRNQQKGKTARAMMYFVIRYQDYASHFSTQETVLINWHNTYPPDSIEERRNHDVFTVQNNRNPFIDYPQLAERITSFVGNSVAVPVNGIDITQTAIDFGTFLNQQADTFNYAIVNRGTATVTFSNFILSNTSILSFGGSFGASLQILPGDALIVPVIIQTSASGSINETLSFNTSIPGGLSSLTIPIRGNSVIVSLEEVSTSSFDFYPNPVEDVLSLEALERGNKQIRIIDLKGRIVKELSTSELNFPIDVSELAKGSYILEVIGETGTERVRFQK